MNVRLMMYKYSNLGSICAKGLCGDESIDKTWKNKVWLVLDSLVHGAVFKRV